MFFSRVRIKDDRGTLVDVFDASSPSVNKQVLSQDSELSDLIHRIAAAKTPGFDQKLSINTLWLLGAGLLIIPGMYFFRTLLPGIPQPIQYIFIGCAIILWTQFFVVRIRRETALISVNTLLSEGRCGSCAYNLSDTPEQDDHCIQCPECGSHWKSARIQPRLRESASQTRKNYAARNSVADTKNMGWNRPPTIIDGEQRALSIINPSLNPPPIAMPPHLAPIAFRLIRKRTRAVRVFIVGLMLLILMLFFDWTVIYNPTLFMQNFTNRFQRLGLVFSGVQILGLVWAFIFMPIIMYRIWTCRTQATVQKVSNALLELNLCPACGSLLPTSTPPSNTAPSPTSPSTSQSGQVSTLTRCTHCAAAWDIPTPQTS